ncbi:MAG TPA: hypothetical protein VMS43_13905 [Allosphingosinicella sp.]|nr:hypothetical protein [Allosphingosinicella sp.]
MMARDHGALIGFLAKRAAMPFRWGSARNDCVSFGALAAKAQTARNPLGGLKWGSRKEALALLDELGGLEAAVDARLRRVAPAMAQRGDIAGVADETFGLRLMVVEGSTLVGPGAHRPERLPRAMMVAAWSLDPDEAADG